MNTKPTNQISKDELVLPKSTYQIAKNDLAILTYLYELETDEKSKSFYANQMQLMENKMLRLREAN